jgi:hypothetical protein
MTYDWTSIPFWLLLLGIFLCGGATGICLQSYIVKRSVFLMTSRITTEFNRGFQAGWNMHKFRLDNAIKKMRTNQWQHRDN